MEEQVIQDNTFQTTDERREGFIFFLGFLVWPFGILLASLRRWDRPWAKNIFWFFCIFFGFTFIIAKQSYDAADSAWYAQVLVQYAHSTMSAGDLWRSFYSEGSNYVDIAQPLITFLVSRFTENPVMLFTVFGLIFGYFYSRNIWFVLKHIKGNFTIIIFLFLLAFALFNPIWNINGFRMWTASQIFFYGALPYLLEGNSKKLYWSVLSVFFHFSFLYPIAILFLFIFLKNRLTIFLIFFILTSLIKEIDLQWVQSILSFLPGFVQPRVGSYTNLQYAELLNIDNQSSQWYLTYSTIGIKWVTYAMTLFIYLFCRKFLNEKRESLTLFCFSLLLYGFANILSFVPSGGRFIIVANSFIFSFFAIFFSTSPLVKGLPLLKILSIPFLLLFCIFTLRVGMDFFGLMTVLGNPILALFDKHLVPLITGLKNLL